MPSSLAPWALDAPPPDHLQTGDILFSRRSRALPDGSGLPPIDLADPVHRALLLRILRASFGDIAVQWLHMTVDELVRHPLLRLLAQAMNQGSAEGFFVGHCALVLRETAGWHDDAGSLFVIEANATDFSHYRVSIHPYHAPADPPADSPKAPEGMSGWVNYRLALGHKVWAARPTCLAPGESGGRIAACNRIIAAAKAQLGRPYGLFDSAVLGDTDRFYCSEFVFASLRQAGTAEFDLTVDDRCTWRWWLEHLGDAPWRRELLHDLQQPSGTAGEPSLYERVIAERFLLLTVQMLWHSDRLQSLFCPAAEGDYA